jgi:hypothetical protein
MLAVPAAGVAPAVAAVAAMVAPAVPPIPAAGEEAALSRVAKLDWLLAAAAPGGLTLLAVAADVALACWR